MSEENDLYGLYQGCPMHGEEFMRECSVCGNEYCASCLPSAGVCADCVGDAEDDLDDDPDFCDVDDLDSIIAEDEEVENIIRESDEMFSGDSL